MGIFLETSIFRPKPVPMSLVGTLVDLHWKYVTSYLGPKNGKMGRKMGQKGAFKGVSKLEIFKSQIFGFSWLGHAQIAVGELHRVSTSMMRCRNPGSRDSK